MITITYDYFENCIELQIITITDYDYPRSDCIKIDEPLHVVVYIFSNVM